MKVRSQKKPSVRKGQMTIQGWARFMQRVLVAAERTQDPRLEGLRRAFQEGENERILRKFSIICDQDIAREFPEKSP